METQMQPEVIKTFFGATQAIAAEQYATDAIVAARLGYAPISQTWDGTKLTVVYQRQTPVEADPPLPAPAERADANAKANEDRAAANAKANQDRADANAWANRERAAANASTPASPPPPSRDRTA